METPLDVVHGGFFQVHLDVVEGMLRHVGDPEVVMLPDLRAGGSERGREGGREG